MIKLSWSKDKNGITGFLWPMFQIYGYYLKGRHVRFLTILESKRKPRHIPIKSVQQGKIIANAYINHGAIPKTVKELNIEDGDIAGDE